MDVPRPIPARLKGQLSWCQRSSLLRAGSFLCGAAGLRPPGGLPPLPCRDPWTGLGWWLHSEGGRGGTQALPQHLLPVLPQLAAWVHCKHTDLEDTPAGETARTPAGGAQAGLEDSCHLQDLRSRTGWAPGRGDMGLKPNPSAPPRYSVQPAQPPLQSPSPPGATVPAPGLLPAAHPPL